MNTTMMLLFVRYESPRLSIDQVAEFMGLDVRTVRNMRAANKLPFAMYQQGSNWFADIHDVAAAHDAAVESARREKAALDAKMHAQAG